jgi:CheY-like chemotaxis protein
MVQSILLLDDDADDCAMFAEALETLSINVNLVSLPNGIEGLRYLVTTPVKPDIIFSDINMPIMNGIEFIQEMRGIESCREIPVVVLSTFDAHNMDAFGHIPFYRKPSTYQRLCDIITEVLMKFNGG